MGVLASRFLGGAEGLVFGPVAVGVDGSQVEHGLGTGDFPAHAAAFQAIFHQVAAGTFDDSGGDGATPPECWENTRFTLGFPLAEREGYGFGMCLVSGDHISTGDDGMTTPPAPRIAPPVSERSSLTELHGPLKPDRDSGLDRFGGFSCNTPRFGERIGVR